MPDSVRRGFRFICVCLLVLAAGSGAVRGESADSLPAAAPHLVAGALRPLPPDEPAVREVRALDHGEAAVALHAAPSGSRVNLTVAPGQTLELEVGHVEVLGPTRTTLTGRIVDQPTSSFTLVAAGRLVVGNVRSDDGETFQLRYAPDGEAVLYTVDESGYAPCATEHDHAVQPPPGGPRAFADDGTVFDVLVAYTPAARSAAGGVAAMNAEIDLAIAETNTSYANSLVNPRVRLAHRVELSYTETGNPSLDLSRLRSTSDGFLDAVHGLRDDYGADLVVLLVSQMDGACGIGYLMTGLSTGFASSAFSVTRLSCATGNLTFGHELGHNMGCAHDRDNASSGLFAYSFGYRTPDSAYRTVMAYAPGQRIMYFSNPNVSFAGRVLGIAPGAAGAAYNALSINNAALTIANFRTGRDCNDNGIDDRCEISCEALPDCPAPPTCGQAQDCDGNEVPDTCELDFNDCNGNSIHDACDLQPGGASADCNGTGLPDECELAGADCNGNTVPDSCDSVALALAVEGPYAAHVCAGAAASFSVSAPPGSSFQWYRGQLPLSDSAKFEGTASPALTIWNTEAGDQASYSCLITSGCISASTPAAALQIVPSVLSISQQPVAQVTLCAGGGQSAVFECRASNELEVSYQWFKDGAPLADGARVTGAQSSRLLIADAALDDQGTYSCEATNTCGGTVTSDPARGRLSVIGATVVTGPQDTCTPVGGPACFHAKLEASPGTQFFWYRNGELLSDGTDPSGMIISGASTPTLALDNVPAAYHGQEFQLVTFLASPTCIGPTEPAGLSVGACGPCRFAGDLDGDLDVDLHDMARFASCFAGLGAGADYCVCADLDPVNPGLDLGDWALFESLADQPR